MNKVALVTNATKYAGVGAVDALFGAGYTLMCHDDAFANEQRRGIFERRYPGAFTSTDKSAGALVDDTVRRCGRIDLFVSNDVFPLRYLEIGEGGASDMREAAEALLIRPFHLLGKVASHMKEQRKGHVVLITSAASERPQAGFSIYGSVRAAASALARAAACELAPHGIIVNAIAPNYLESDLYYPPDLWGTDKAAGELKKAIPLGRLGKPKELGALIVFLASGDADFVTGEVINFTGGWPLQ